MIYWPFILAVYQRSKSLESWSLSFIYIIYRPMYASALRICFPRCFASLLACDEL